MALAAYLANTRARVVALVAMVLSIVGIALMLPILGVRAYALPAVGLAYLDGQEDAIAIVNIIFDSPLATVIYVVVVAIYSAGFLLFGVAIWRSGVLRKPPADSLGPSRPSPLQLHQVADEPGCDSGRATIYPRQHLDLPGRISKTFPRRSGAATRKIIERRGAHATSEPHDTLAFFRS